VPAQTTTSAQHGRGEVAVTTEGTASDACGSCLRRSWLLRALGVVLDYRGRDPDRLLSLLTLEDESLIEAIAGRRRGEVREMWKSFRPEDLPSASGIESTCRHCESWPRALGETPEGPCVLHFSGGYERLRSLTHQDSVAIVGSGRTSDYGMEMARSLARGLAASGVTVVSGFAEGVSAAAHGGALEANGRPIAAMAGGADVCKPAERRALYGRVRARGCIVAELPNGFHERRWCGLARTRTVAGLATVTVVVEAGEGQRELAPARVAQAFGRTVAAVPGRVTSSTAQGTCELLMQGAPLVRDAKDVLDLLGGAYPAQRARRAAGVLAMDHAPLGPRLGALLEQVGAGRDTLGRLTATGGDGRDTMAALSELELMGLLGRGDGGRYVVRERIANENVARRG
jgi:DNA processing protein